MKRRLGALLLGAALVTTAGCHGSSSPVDNSNTGPSTPVTTETFTNTVDVGGKAFNAFSVLISGSPIAVTMTAAGPPSTIFMGIGLGTFSATDSSCTLLQNGFVNTQAGSLAQISGTVNAGAYCVMVYDIGNQTAQISYSVTVSHF